MSVSCNNSPPSDGKYLVVATTNEDKFFEIRTALGQIGIALYTLKSFAQIEPPEETGSTFLENARLKATCYFQTLQKPLLAEDSGLVIPSLGGFPGIHSARVAPTDADRIRLVLDRLGSSSDRAAFYQCSMVFLFQGQQYEAEGFCQGRITGEAVGDRGFGYDPIFQPDGSPRTFGEMSIREKTNFSHRGKAARELIPALLQTIKIQS